MKIHSKSTNYKDYPIVRAIHLNVTNQRRRFMSTVDPAFTDLFHVMAQPDFDMDILTDEGKASASPELMAAVENGTREIAQRCVHVFGAMAAKDPEAYVRAMHYLVHLRLCVSCVLAISPSMCTCDINRALRAVGGRPRGTRVPSDCMSAEMITNPGKTSGGPTLRNVTNSA